MRLRTTQAAGLALLVLGVFCPSARADSSVELSAATGFGVLAVGVTPGRFAISPSASVSLRGERGFFVARDTLSFLGAAGGPFGINNETTVGGGLFWEQVNVSAGVSLTTFLLPICGPRLCDRQVRGVVPGASVRADFFGPYLSGALGISLDCSGIWITGRTAPVWSGVAVRCSAGPSSASPTEHPTRKDRPMRSLLCSRTLLAAGLLAVACTTADPNECFVNTGAGFGGSGTIPIGAGVGVSSGGEMRSPSFHTLGNGQPANPCETPSGVPTPVAMLPPICRTDPPRFCATVCQYPPPMPGLAPVPYLTKECSEPSAGMLEALFAHDVETTLDCGDTEYPDESYVVTPTWFSITPVNVPVVMPGVGVVQCMMPLAPPPTDTLDDWNKQQ